MSAYMHDHLTEIILWAEKEGKLIEWTLEQRNTLADLMQYAWCRGHKSGSETIKN